MAEAERELVDGVWRSPEGAQRRRDRRDKTKGHLFPGCEYVDGLWLSPEAAQRSRDRYDKTKGHLFPGREWVGGRWRSQEAAQKARDRRDKTKGHLFAGGWNNRQACWQGKYIGTKTAATKAIKPKRKKNPPPLDKLRQKAIEKGQPVAKRQTITTTQPKRVKAVTDYVIARAAGICECGCEVAFPYLQSHHVKGLADDGPDTIYNCLALRPDCHAKAENEPEFNETLFARLEAEQQAT